MRKKVLIKKTEELIGIMNSLQKQLENLKSENAELKDKIAGLESQKAVPVVQETVEEGFTVYVEEPIAQEIPAEPIELPVENEILEYGAIAIGKVVQESVKYANLISESASDSKKELLNLIMGKAEITKAEIFSITDGNIAADLKKDLIDTQCDEAVDYFKSAYGQITE